MKKLIFILILLFSLPAQAQESPKLYGGSGSSYDDSAIGDDATIGIDDGSTYDTISNDVADDTLNKLFNAIDTWAATVFAITDITGQGTAGQSIVDDGDGTLSMIGYAPPGIIWEAAPTGANLVVGKTYYLSGLDWDPAGTLVTVGPAATIAFVEGGASADTITDSGSGFGSIQDGDHIRVSGSTSNDGDYTVATAVVGTLTLIDTDDLTDESASASITVTANQNYQVIRSTDESWVRTFDDMGNLAIDKSQASSNVIASASAITLSEGQMNSVIVMTGAGDVDIPADQCDTATGKFIVVKSTAAHLNSITSNDASDQFILHDGTALTAENELDLAGAAGNQICVMCLQANKWHVTGYIGTPTDGGAAD